MKQRNVYDVGGKYLLVIKLTVFIALARAWEGGWLFSVSESRYQDNFMLQ